MSQKSKKTEEKNQNDEAMEPASETEAKEVAESPEKDLQEQLNAAREEAEKNKESFLLASAEAENIRKRAQNEMANTRKYAVEKFAAELLSVRDSLDLASSTEIDTGDNEAVEKMREGLSLTLKQLDAVFEKFNITVIDPMGEKFNPEHHQAMVAVENPDMEPNHVMDVMQKGYLLHDRLLRPAMVVVTKAPADNGADKQD